MFDIKKANGIAGFKSITNRSIWMRSSRYRERLIELSLMCVDNQLTCFVQNIDDIDKLFNSMTPNLYKYFEVCFDTNKFTSKIQSLPWYTGLQSRVISADKSSISEKEVKKGLDKVTPVFKKNTNVLVDTHMLRIDWVYNENSMVGDSSKNGFGHLIKVLANSPHEELYGTELVESLTAHFYETYYSQIILFVLIPYLIYFIGVNYYFMIYMKPKFKQEELFAFTGESICRHVIYLGILFFSTIEITQLIDHPLRYVRKFSNYVELTSIFLNSYLMWNHMQKESLFDEIIQQALAAVGVFLMWLRLLHFLRLFDSFSFYIRLMVDTVYDILYFLFVYVIILCAFAAALFVLNQNRDRSDDNSNLIPNAFG